MDHVKKGGILAQLLLQNSFVLHIIQSCFKGDSNPNDKYVLSEKAL